MEIAAPADQHRAAAAPATRKRPISYLPSRTLISSGIPRRYSVNNPVIGVDKLVHDEEGAKPWPEDGYRFVMANAPEDLRRMAFLGHSTGQRASDLVRMRPSTWCMTASMCASASSGSSGISCH